MPVAVCTESALGALIKCFECVNDNQQVEAMKAVLLCQLAQPAGITCTNGAQLRAASACIGCHSDKDLQLMELAVLNQAAVSIGRRTDGSATALIADARCLMCLPPHDLRAINTWLLCKLIAEAFSD